MWPSSLLLLFSLTDAIAATERERHLVSKSCPGSCDRIKGVAEWPRYHDTASIAVCPEPMLLQYNLYTPFDDPNTHHTFRACTLGNYSTESNFLADKGFVSPGAKEAAANFGPTKHRRQGGNDTISNSNTTCGAGVSSGKSSTSARLSRWTVDASLTNDISSDVALAVDKLVEDVQASSACDKYLMFAYVRGTLVGLYSGSLIDKSKTPAALMKQLAGEIQGEPVRAALEICGEGRTGSNTIGVVVDTSGDFAAVQKIMKSWNEADCLSRESQVRKWGDTKALDGTDVWSFDSLPVLTRRMVNGQQQHPSSLVRRADCRTIRVEDKDTCTTLAAKCGIGGTALQNFNKNTPDLCSTLQPGQPVCCSAGTLPDIRPPPQADGTCATYDIAIGEGCQSVAVRHGLTVTDLNEFNKETWGWDGCDNLQIGQRVCVSQGKAPMPAPIEGAVCGPQVPGTKPPAEGQKMADLNPCLLDVCCNVWGNCGTTREFCIVSQTTTGNPGTSKPGENGCQSNCGMDVVNNGQGPAQYRKIGYFEAWIDGRITADHRVDIPVNERRQWQAFVAARNYPKKILAFGGWAFSNEGWEARLLREVIQPGARCAFSDRVVQFAIDNKLNGLDFDWEYPGATDIEGSPPGREDDGENYYEFLKLVRAKLPQDMSLSIAAPASYWYLRGFPIKKMAEVLDYIVYMTYDFHGQWDVGNKFTISGCPAGNCLRSHINSTLTRDALVMITKAGVPSHKVVVGVSSYGRSFKMADAGCRGPMCTFTGTRNNSPARPGRCTETGGYISDFEINEIIKRGGAIKTWYDQDSDSDFLVYAQTEFVGYMAEATKNRRIEQYKAGNWGGTSDWAIDLNGSGSSDFDNGNETAPPFTPNPDGDVIYGLCPHDPTTMEQIKDLKDRGELPGHCAPKYLIPILHRMLQEAKDRFDQINRDGYDRYFGVYADYMVSTAGGALHQFMLDNGDKFFNCKVYTEKACCTSCEWLGVSCTNCNPKCEVIAPGDDGIRFFLEDMRCLPNTDSRGFNSENYKYESTFFSFKGDTERDDFYAAMGLEVGVPREKTRIVQHGLVPDPPTRAFQCLGSVPHVPPPYDELPQTCKHEFWWHDAPRIDGYASSDVYNPKGVISETFAKIDIDEALAEFGMTVSANNYEPEGADEYDLVDAIMLPIFMIQAGLEHMETVVEMAKKLIEADKLTFITNLLSGILLIVGGAGGLLASTSLRALGRAFVVLAELGNTGLGLHAAITNPSSTPLLIFGLVMSGVGIRDAFKVGQAANLRRGTSAEALESISPSTRRNADIASAANQRPGKRQICRPT